jgi:hypothetical protein
MRSINDWEIKIPSKHKAPKDSKPPKPDRYFSFPARDKFMFTPNRSNILHVYEFNNSSV